MKPAINYDKCVSCGRCVRECAAGCIKWLNDARPVINEQDCIECLTCQEACPAGAIR